MPGREQRPKERDGRAGNGAREDESVLAVIRARRPVICGRAGLLIVTGTPPRFYISASRSDHLSHTGRVMRYQLRAVLYLLPSRDDER